MSSRWFVLPCSPTVTPLMTIQVPPPPDRGDRYELEEAQDLSRQGTVEDPMVDTIMIHDVLDIGQRIARCAGRLQAGA